MTKKRARAIGMAFTALVTLTLGCSKIQTSTGSAHRAGNAWTVHGVLRVGSYEDLDNLNPVLSTQAFVSDVAQMVFSGLIDYDDHANPIPDVASVVPTQSNGGISRDGKTITYHLRSGVRFSDGVPLTSADVKYTWQQIVNPNNNVGYRFPYDQVVSIDTPDDRTVVVHLKVPTASFIAAFMRNGVIGSIVPKHLLVRYADLNRVPFNNKPIGSGPFVVESWEPGALLVLRANQSYWRGPPKLKKVLYRIIPSQNTLLTDVLSHNLDLYYDAPEVQYATLKSLAGYRLTAVPNMDYEHVDFNCLRPPLDDVRVRQAIAYAIDWKKLADDVYFGLDTPGMADTPPISWAYDPSVKPYPHNVARARALLRAAGWTPDAGGVMRKNGEPFHIDITTVAGVSTRAKAEELIQQDLRAVGIQLDIHNYPANLLFATYGSGGILAHGRFYLSLYAWQFTIPDPDDTNTMGPDGLPPKGENYTFYRDVDVGAWQRAGQAYYDRAARRPNYVRLQHRFHERVPFHTIVWRSNIDVVNADLRNFKPAPAVSDFWNSWEWQL
ncbi:MAG: peptide ABC transporter substrate-binding protein [Candidatus Eremiobacteraeota bacterium]|nr:peptide ABC transporter substrate-binding protein [Candidatus Eremiobacteraeota bacterium]